MTGDLVYGRRPVHEALRGPRQVLELRVSDRALRAEPWLREEANVRPRLLAERELTVVAGTPDHQGVVALCEPYRYAAAEELASGPDPLLVCLDGVTDPRNLGAVCRSVEGAGATGVVLPAHGSAHVTAAVCRASAGAVEHLRLAVVKNLSRFLSDLKRPTLWIWATDADAATSMWSADLSGGVAFVLGAEGKGLRPLVRKTCDDEVAIPLGGRVESLNVSVAAALLLYEAKRQRLSRSEHG